MLAKLLNFSRRKKPLIQRLPEEEKTSLALRIIHAGGCVEVYYMATPAGRIMEKHPGFVIARPEVFKRPWDSVVRPDKILVPGQKFFLVPRRTIKKLRRRIKKPDRDATKLSINPPVSMDLYGINEELSKSYISDSSGVGGSFTSALKKRKNVIKKHVRFVDIEAKQKGKGNSRKSTSKSPNSRNSGSWQPSLRSITESSSNE